MRTLLAIIALVLAHTASAHIGSPNVFFDGDAKEAVAFALLGYLTLHGQPGNVPAATGASQTASPAGMRGSSDP